MFAASFGLSENPFKITPNLRFVYLGKNFQKVREEAIERLLDGNGAVLLTARAGVGKSILLRLMAEDLDSSDSAYRVLALSCSPGSTIDHLVRQALDAIEPSPLQDTRTDGDHLDRLIAECVAADRPCVLLIDEAQNLSDHELGRLFLLIDRVDRDGGRLRMALAGPPEFEARLDRALPGDFRRRIVLRRRLEPLPEREVAAFIAERLEAAGSPRDDLFSPDAVRSVARYSEGVPRLVNTLCGTALFLAEFESQDTVSADLVEEAARHVELVPPQPAESPEENKALVPSASRPVPVVQPFPTSDRPIPDRPIPDRLPILARFEHLDAPSTAEADHIAIPSDLVRQPRSTIARRRFWPSFLFGASAAGAVFATAFILLQEPDRPAMPTALPDAEDPPVAVAESPDERDIGPSNGDAAETAAAEPASRQSAPPEPMLPEPTLPENAPPPAPAIAPEMLAELDGIDDDASTTAPNPQDTVPAENAAPPAAADSAEAAAADGTDGTPAEITDTVDDRAVAQILPDVPAAQQPVPAETVAPTPPDPPADEAAEEPAEQPAEESVVAAAEQTEPPAAADRLRGATDGAELAALAEVGTGAARQPEAPAAGIEPAETQPAVEGAAGQREPATRAATEEADAEAIPEAAPEPTTEPTAGAAEPETLAGEAEQGEQIAALPPEPEDTTEPEATTEPETPADSEKPTQEAAIDDLLKRARDQIDALALTLPKGNNAYETYRQVLTLAPDHPQALQGLQDIVVKYVELARNATRKGATDRAQQYYAKAAAIAPDHPALKTLAVQETTVQEAREPQAVAALPQPAPEVAAPAPETAIAAPRQTAPAAEPALDNASRDALNRLLAQVFNETPLTPAAPSNATEPGRGQQQTAARGTFPLPLASLDDPERLRAAIAAGGDVNTRFADGRTPLIVATAQQRSDIIDLLLASGAEPNTATDALGTPLMYAVWNGDLASVETLLQSGADVNLKNIDGKTALMAAAANGHAEVVDTLLRYGAAVNAKTLNGWTSLMYAVWGRHAEVVALLIREGADIMALNEDGETAAGIATERGHFEIANMLRSQQARNE